VPVGSIRHEIRLPGGFTHTHYRASVRYGSGGDHGRPSPTPERHHQWLGRRFGQLYSAVQLTRPARPQRSRAAAAATDTAVSMVDLKLLSAAAGRAPAVTTLTRVESSLLCSRGPQVAGECLAGHGCVPRFCKTSANCPATVATVSRYSCHQLVSSGRTRSLRKSLRRVATGPRPQRVMLGSCAAMCVPEKRTQGGRRSTQNKTGKLSDVYSSALRVSQQHAIAIVLGDYWTRGAVMRLKSR
jgi:hypothetical protein